VSEHPLRFLVTDRGTAERGFRVKVPYAVISIRDPERPQARISGHPRPRDVLYLAFDDAEPVRGLPLPADIQLMTPQQAQTIWRFFDRYRGEIGAVLCHCEQGMSRSPAVAAALCEGTGGDSARFFREYQPNQHVFRLVLEARRGGG
jgi:predicted protein tyrosine phosphatase